MIIIVQIILKYSVSGEKALSKKVVFICLCSALAGVVMSFIFSFDSRRKKYAEFDGEKYSVSAKNIDELRKSADNFGISVSFPEKVRNIKIPMEFNEVYEDYNRLQYDIGMDLEEYRGEECILYTFAIDEEKVLNMISWNGQFIGGDISDRDFLGKIISLSSKFA